VHPTWRTLIREQLEKMNDETPLSTLKEACSELVESFPSDRVIQLFISSCGYSSKKKKKKGVVVTNQQIQYNHPCQGRLCGDGQSVYWLLVALAAVPNLGTSFYNEPDPSRHREWLTWYALRLLRTGGRNSELTEVLSQLSASLHQDSGGCPLCEECTLQTALDCLTCGSGYLHTVITKKVKIVSNTSAPPTKEWTFTSAYGSKFALRPHDPFQQTYQLLTAGEQAAIIIWPQWKASNKCEFAMIYSRNSVSSRCTENVTPERPVHTYGAIKNLDSWEGLKIMHRLTASKLEDYKHGVALGGLSRLRTLRDMTAKDQLLFVLYLRQILATQLDRPLCQVDIMISPKGLTHDPCFKIYPTLDRVVEHQDQEYMPGLPEGTKTYSAVLVLNSKAEPLQIRLRSGAVAYIPLQPGDICIFDGELFHWTTKAQKTRRIIALQLAVVPVGEIAPLDRLLSDCWTCSCGHLNPELVSKCWQCELEEEEEEELEEEEEEGEHSPFVPNDEEQKWACHMCRHENQSKVTCTSEI
jgi:hypothetical protein